MSGALSSRARAVTALVAMLAVVTAACMPQDKGAAGEVSNNSGAANQVAAPPKFPENGPVSAELLVAGLMYDFTSVPKDLDLWAPPTDQARCAADKIVTGLGATTRLSELGYRPATSGASLNDISLSVAEKNLVAATFANCVDLAQGVAALLIGDGRRMKPKAAKCVADGLASKDLLLPFAKAWAFGEEVDPFENDNELAANLLAYSNVCISNTSFNYPGVSLPGDEKIEDENKRNGVTTTVPTDPSSDGLLSSDNP